MRPLSRLAMSAVLAISAAYPTAAPAQGLFGPAKFKIEVSDDRFSSDGLTTVTGRNNRLSNRSLVGGIYLDGKGLYRDPMAIKSRSDGKVREVGFVVHNETDRDSDNGSPNTFGTIERISFLLDGGKLVVAEVAHAETQDKGGVQYNSLTGIVSTDLRESGTLRISAEDMAAIAASHTLAVKVDGSRRSWTCEAAQISKKFLPNLAAFYRQVVATASAVATPG